MAAESQIPGTMEAVGQPVAAAGTAQPAAAEQPAPPPVVEKPKQPKKKLWMIVGGVLLVLVLIGVVVGAFYMGKRQAEPSPTSTPEATVAPVVDEYEGWEEGQYEDLKFMYPAGWSVAENKSLYEFAGVDLDEERMFFSTMDNPNTLLVPEYVAEKAKEGPPPNFYLPSSIERVGGGLTGYYTEENYCPPSSCDTYAVANGTSIYVLTYLYAQDKGASERSKVFFDKIIESIEFVEEVDTSGWGTHINDKHGYQINIPNDWNKVIDPKTDGREIAFESPKGEFLHLVVFDSAADTSGDNAYRKTYALPSGGSLLVTYVECDGPGCGYGKLDLEAFKGILESFEFVE